MATAANDDVDLNRVGARLYDGRIRPELQALEARRQGALSVFTAALLVAMAAAVGEVAMHLDIRILVATVTVVSVLGYIPLGRLQAEAKTAIILALCEPLGVSYLASDVHPPAWPSYLSLKLLPHSDDQTFADQLTGARRGAAFSVCEATLTTGEGRDRETVFSGKLFKIASPRPFLGRTVVLRDSGWLNRFVCPAGLKKVGLEDPVFEHAFEVFADDQVESRAILTPTVMEQLLALEKAYAGRHLRCGFCDGDILIAIEGGAKLDIGSMFSTLVDAHRVERIAANLQALMTTIDAFVAVRS